MKTFTVDDIHRRNMGTVVVVGIQSTDGKVFAASARIAAVLRDASARELGKFLGQLANLDARDQVVSFTSTVPVVASAAPEIIGAPAIDLSTLPLADECRAINRQAARGESISLDGLGLNIGGR